jgi:excisionase family DNA binding protein
VTARVLGPERRAFSVSEAAEMLGLHRQTVAAAIRRGDLPAVRLGRKVLVPRAALDRFLDTDTAANREPVR